MLAVMPASATTFTCHVGQYPNNGQCVAACQSGGGHSCQLICSYCGQCDNAADCNDGNVCTNDVCYKPEHHGDHVCQHTNNANSCNDGNACTQTDTCSAGVCVGSNPKVCSNPFGDCGSAGTCNSLNGLCSAASPFEAGTSCDTGKFCDGAGSCVVCLDDEDCGEHQLCISNECVTQPFCGDQVCNDDETFDSCPVDCPQCEVNADCEENQLCVDGACQNCPEGQHVADGQCVPDTCPNDFSCSSVQVCVEGGCVDCQEGYHAEDNQCVPNPQCEEDADCPTGQLCGDGQCYDPCADVQCPDGEHCEMGNCVPNPVVGGGSGYSRLDEIEQFGDDRLVTAGIATMLSMGGESELQGEGTGLEYGFEAAPENGVEGSKYVILSDTCKQHVLYIELKTPTEVQTFQIYYYRAGDGLFVNNYEKIMPWNNFVQRGRYDYTGGVLVLEAQNPNTAIHTYARLRTLDTAAYEGNFRMQMTVRGSNGEVLWTGFSEEGKRDMDVIFLLDPFQICIHPADFQNAIYNAGTWHGLPKQ